MSNNMISEEISEEMLENVSGGVAIATLPNKKKKNTTTSQPAAADNGGLSDSDNSSGLYTLEMSAKPPVSSGLSNKRVRTL